MSDVMQVLSQNDAAEPLVHEELRRLAAVKFAQDYPGQTLQATALVALNTDAPDS